MTTPVLYLSHGAPPLADDRRWTAELAGVSAALERPTAILIVSAHWEAAPLTLAATETVPLLYDFGGFPERYYQIKYAAPGAPQLADQVRKLLHSPGTPVYDDPTRGLDHGAYVPLKEMYPDADVPVLQVSMPTLDPTELFRIGQKLAPLRDQGVLIVGSGFTTHNLREMNFAAGVDAPAPSWSIEFDDWTRRALQAQDVDALIDFLRKAPAATIAHPRTEHFAPLFVTLGAAANQLPTAETVIDGFWYGLSKRSWQIG
ncbi:class III extradiol ring-cleavage dioxygenase [Kribbella albertanoniae]|uniref:Dioxygenase n=1 Tax=Kribbella albertanoniae TaxID=1266829 RepID=A0A4R4QCQ0_9ACTN|nr:class III extradiol ring-cleavage dioxygenase [Kribbella albertanoniae]TDC32842.1 dioxygenase [Kribbella albertanoniae]